MKTADLERLYEQSRSQAEDVRIAVAADVINALLKNAREGRTFRYMLYDLLDFSPAAYTPLYLAGGAAIVDTYAVPDLGLEGDEPQQLVALRTLADAAAMIPHPTLTTVAGDPVPMPSPERSALFAALHYAEDLVGANRQLHESVRRLTERCEQFEGAQAASRPSTTLDTPTLS